MKIPDDDDTLLEDPAVRAQVRQLGVSSADSTPGIFADDGDAITEGVYRGALEAKATAQRVTGDIANRAIWIGKGIAGGGGIDNAAPLQANDEEFDERQALIDAEVERSARAARDLRPDPYTHGQAAVIANELSALIPRTVGATMLGGPVAGAVAAGAPAGQAEAGRLEAEGVDPQTASTVGAVHATTIGIGAILPVAGIAKGALTDVGLAAVGNVGLGVANRAIVHDTLAGAGYQAQADQYRAWDPTAIAIDAGFSLILSGTHRMTTPQRDAVLTARVADFFRDGDGLVGTDPASTRAAASAKANALEQLLRGDEVRVADQVDGAAFVSDPARGVRALDPETIAPAEAAALRLKPSTRLAEIEPAERTALRYDAPELDEYAAHVEQELGLPAGLINALKNAGEKSNSHQVSPAGARGVMQFMPENLKKFGVTDPTDPVQMIDAAGRYLKATMGQYGGNVDAVIADYNGGPRQARRVLNGERPAAAETAAYLDRVRAYLGRRAPERPVDVAAFAERTGRTVDAAEPAARSYADGTAYAAEAIPDFYQARVHELPPGDATPMPDVLFLVGRADEITTEGLQRVLPDFDPTQNEVRISAQAVKHIHDSHPDQAPALIARLQDGTLYADEVLPNPRSPERALVVLRDVPTSSKKAKHGVTVVEVAANGKGIDVVTSFTGPESTLKKARAMGEARKGIESSRPEGRQYPHPPAPGQARVPRAEADFPTIGRNDSGKSIPPDGEPGVAAGPGKAAGGADGESLALDLAAARELAAELPDEPVFVGTDADGNPIYRPLGEALAELEAQMQREGLDAEAYARAASCFLRRGA